MSYDKQTWVDGVTLVDADKMNHIEQGVETIHNITASEWSSTKNYKEGEYCFFDNMLWRSNVSNMESRPDAMNVDWKKCTIGEELGKLDIKDLSGYVTSQDNIIQHKCVFKIGNFVIFDIAWYYPGRSVSGDVNNPIQFTDYNPKARCNSIGTGRNGSNMCSIEFNINTDGTTSIYVPSASQYLRAVGSYYTEK